MKTAKKYKICRRVGAGVFEKCQTAKFAASVTGQKKKLKIFGIKWLRLQIMGLICLML